jgi:hypothetical protein
LLWEKLIPFGSVLDVVEATDHELLVLSWVPEAQGTYARLDRLDESGAIVHTGQVAGGDPGSLFVRPVAGTSLDIITQDRRSAMRLVRLDNALQDAGKPVELERFNSKRAYMLPDQAIAIFGSVFRRGDTAAAALLPKGSSSLNVTALEPLNQSPVINDATPTGRSGEFAAVRITGQRAVLTWMSLDK